MFGLLDLSHCIQIYFQLLFLRFYKRKKDHVGLSIVELRKDVDVNDVVFRKTNLLKKNMNERVFVCSRLAEDLIRRNADSDHCLKSETKSFGSYLLKLCCRQESHREKKSAFFFQLS